MFKNINKKKAILSLAFNALIFLLMIVGVFVIIFVEKADWKVFKWFTFQSNVVMGAASLIYLILLSLLVTNKINKLPKAIEIVKLVATTGVVLTFFTVVLLLTPEAVMNKRDIKNLYLNSSLFFHVLIPILSALTWLLFEHSENKYVYAESWYTLIHIVAYGIFYIVMAFTHMKDGKFQDGYDWYGFISLLGVKLCPLVFIGMFAVSYLFGWSLWIGNKKINLFPNTNK